MIRKDGAFVHNGEVIAHKDTHRTIRGFPRDKQVIKDVESNLGGTLLDDKKDGKLILLLDRYYMLARLKGQNPDYLAIQEDPFSYYVPIPFEMNLFGSKIKNYIKPAWARVPRKFKMGVPSWK